MGRLNTANSDLILEDGSVNVAEVLYAVQQEIQELDRQKNLKDLEMTMENDLNDRFKDDLICRKGECGDLTDDEKIDLVWDDHSQRFNIKIGDELQADGWATDFTDDEEWIALINDGNIALDHWNYITYICPTCSSASYNCDCCLVCGNGIDSCPCNRCQDCDGVILITCTCPETGDGSDGDNGGGDGDAPGSGVDGDTAADGWFLKVELGDFANWIWCLGIITVICVVVGLYCCFSQRNPVIQRPPPRHQEIQIQQRIVRRHQRPQSQQHTQDADPLTDTGVCRRRMVFQTPIASLAHETGCDILQKSS